MHASRQRAWTPQPDGAATAHLTGDAWSRYAPSLPRWRRGSSRSGVVLARLYLLPEAALHSSFITNEPAVEEDARLTTTFPKYTTKRDLT